jgi:fructose/tagatose bisphosphate aldolase
VSGRIIVHSLEHARAAVAAAASLGVPVTLVSAPGAGAYAGPAWFKALVETAAAAHPEVAVTAVIDCGEEPGTVLAALRAGFRRVRFTGPETARAALAEIVAARGAAIEFGATPALDLLDVRDAEAACRAYLTAPQDR